LLLYSQLIISDKSKNLNLYLMAQSSKSEILHIVFNDL